jgi:hypothetical protein
MAILNDNQFSVVKGTIDIGMWTLEGKTFKNYQSASFESDLLVSCELVSDNHGTKQSGMGQIAGGLLGMAVAGPLGAIGGLMTGGRSKVNETIIYCSLSDGRNFTAYSTQTGFAILKSMVQLNRDRVISNNSFIQNNNNFEEKECSNCAEMCKERAKKCRFCGHSFDIDDAARLKDKFIIWKKHFEKLCNYSFEDKDVDKFYYALAAIDKIGSSVAECYTLEWNTVNIFYGNWDGTWKATPNERFFENLTLAEKIEDMNLDAESPNKISDEILIKTVEDAIALMR